ncbi:Holliday junction resolvase [Achromatium sp. WMS2]|nr:Holliday junction resolvase [Achromatium sp. WMS2]
MTVLLGFDYGPRKIGIAVGQVITGTASPLVTLRTINNQPDWQKINHLVSTWTPKALVVGIPFDHDGIEMDWTPMIHRFIRQLKARFSLPVHQINEFLTSIEARNLMGRAARSHEVVDAVAAALILETWFSEQH